MKPAAPPSGQSAFDVASLRFGTLPGGQRKMQPNRLTLGALVVCACACKKSIDLPPLGIGPAEGAGAGGDRAGQGGGPAPLIDANHDSTSAVDDSRTVGGEAMGKVLVVHDEAGPPRTGRAGDMATLGSSQLAAGGATPRGACRCLQRRAFVDPVRRALSSRIDRGKPITQDARSSRPFVRPHAGPDARELESRSAVPACRVTSASYP
jgi:hypothetical protein